MRGPECDTSPSAAARAQAASHAHGGRDRPRRGDGERQLRPHRHARAQLDRIFDESYANADAVVTGARHALLGDRHRRGAALPGDGAAAHRGAAGGRRVARVGRGHGSPCSTARAISSPRPRTAWGWASTPAERGAQPAAHGRRTLPQGAEIVIDRTTANDDDSPSARRSPRSRTGRRRPYRIAGLVQFGSGESLGGNLDRRLRPADTAQRLFDHVGKLDEIQVPAAGGTSTPSRVGHPAGCAPGRPGEDRRRTGRDASEDITLGPLLHPLLPARPAASRCSWAASWSPTRRSQSRSAVRELATLRTLGASRRQVLGRSSSRH